MTQENPFRIFYDSEILNESDISDEDNDVLNTAFTVSPGKSLTYLLDNSSLSDLSGMLEKKDETENQEKVSGQKVTELSENKDGIELSYQRNHIETAIGTSMESGLKQYSVSNSGNMDINEKNWVSSAKRNSKAGCDRLYEEIGTIPFLEVSMTVNLSKKNEKKSQCLFSSTLLDKFEKGSKEYDWRKLERRSFLDMDDETEKVEPKIRVSVTRLDYEYHELSTIPEIDSMFMDESVESPMNIESVNAKDSFEFIQPKASSYFPANVMTIMQNQHVEKFLQEPGILEESDLTLISTDDFDTISRISEKSMEKGHCHSYYKIKHFNDEESPSLISFQQHEISCMKDCFDE